MDIDTDRMIGMARANFDLEDRLLKYSARIIGFVDSLPATRASNHIAGQLLRSGTSPLPNHGEAQAAESRADFLHKIQICLKELRETHRWLKLIRMTNLLKDHSEADKLIRETDELTRIFVSSVVTARRKNNAPDQPNGVE
jgi:four helix bundle protein